MMWIKKLLLILLLCSVCQAANDFSGDANCFALWNFENGQLTTDSKSTNTLTNSGVVADTVNYKEGLASGDWEMTESDYMTIADGSLSAGFPLKNGDANKKISVCFWYRMESLPVNNNDYKVLCSKYNSTLNSRSFAVIHHKSLLYGQELLLQIGHTNGTNAESQWLDRIELAVNVWYHVGVTFQDSDKAFRIRLYDSASTNTYDRTGTFLNNVSVEDAAWTIGQYASLVAGVYHDGLIDEMVVFNDILSSGEIDQIRSGTFSAATVGGGQLITIQEF